MNKEYVKQYVRLEKEHWWFVVRKKIILQVLKKYIHKNQVSILNVGAAGGASSQWLSVFGNVVSVENEPGFIEQLKEKNFQVVEASVITMPFENNSFDVVCAFDVIEHVDNDAAAMNELQRVCKTGGVVCVTVPAFPLLWSSHDIANGHVRRYTKNSLLTLAEFFPQLLNAEIRYFNSLLFLPILVARKFSAIFKKDAVKGQSDFTFYKTPRILNALFKLIFSAEPLLLPFISFPVGVSMIGVWKKTGTNNKE